MNYFLFLKSKMGDFTSTRYMGKSGVVPVFDFISGESELQKIEKKQDKFIENIKRYFSEEILFYIDHNDMDSDIRYPSNVHPYSKYGQLLSLGYNLGLVTGLDRDYEYNEQVKSYARIYKGLPIAIRLSFGQILAPRILMPELYSFYHEFSLFTDRIDIIIDCRVLNEDIDIYFERIKRFIDEFEKLAIDCLVVVTGSSIPEKINDIVKTGMHTSIDRKEGLLWNKVESINTLYSSIVYGDYGVVSPDFEELDTNGPVPIVPKITYTFSDSYYVTRGFKTNLHDDGYGQYKSLAREVMQLANYRHGFSYGERYIEIIGDDSNDKKGNPTTWITATMVQHIDFIKTIL